jgi:acetolactate synthase regulatory subunit
MFVNKIPFFVTISRDIKFGTSKLQPNQKNAALKTALSHVLSIYKTRGFVVQTILMDGQLEPLCSDIADLQLTLNTVSNDEHVPEVEHHIQTLKERTHCIYNTLLFKRLPA